MNSNTTEIKSKLQHVVEVEEHFENGWNFIFTKAGILTTSDLDMLSDLLILQGVPDCVFGNNTGVLYNDKLKFAFFINARDALHFCNFDNRKKHLLDRQQQQELYIQILLSKVSFQVNHISVIPEDVKLKTTEQWKKMNVNPEIKILERISDTFYSTPYKGSVVNSTQLKFWYEKFEQIKQLKGKCILENQFSHSVVKNDGDYLLQVFGPALEDENQPFTEVTTDEIPIGNLGEANPILWACHIPLFEDELGDNGNVNCEFRFRVMKDCFFGLIRNYLRVDDVIIRIYDTRIYHDFNWNYILREFTCRESTWSEIMAKGFQFTPQWSISPQQSFMIQNSVDVKLVVREKIYFSKPKQQ